MDTADDLFEQAERDTSEVRSAAVGAVEAFIGREGQVFGFDDAVSLVQAEVVDDEELARDVVAHLISDGVDPVIQVTTNQGRHVMVAEFVSGDWWYGYKDFDDVRGEGIKVVCRACVDEDKHPSEVGKAFSLDLDSPPDDYEGMAEWLFERHFEARHPDTDPASVPGVIGASLATGTTIASNTAWHDGNVTAGTNIQVSGQTIDVGPQGSTSGLDADTVDGSHAADLGGPSAVTFNMGIFGALESATRIRGLGAGDHAANKRLSPGFPYPFQSLDLKAQVYAFQGGGKVKYSYGTTGTTVNGTLGTPSNGQSVTYSFTINKTDGQLTFFYVEHTITNVIELDVEVKLNL